MGILGHSKGRADLAGPAVEPSAAGLPLEATTVRICDRIAYVNHDIDDAVRAGLLAHDSLPHETLEMLGRSHGERITTMVRNVIETSLDKPQVSMSEPVLGATNRLKDFLFTNVYVQKNAAKAELAKGSDLLKRLFRLYMEQPHLVPYERVNEEMDTEARACAVLDYLAGMTDRFAGEQFLHHFFPANWSSTGSTPATPLL